MPVNAPASPTQSTWRHPPRLDGVARPYMNYLSGRYSVQRSPQLCRRGGENNGEEMAALSLTLATGTPMENSAPSSLRAHQLASAMLGVLSIIGLSLVADILTTALPLRTGDVAWRFQVEALVLNTVPQWALILMVVLAVGLHGERLGALKAGAIVCLVLAGILALLLPFFALDFLTVRHLQTQSRLPTFQRVGIKVAGIAALLVPALVWAGVRGLAASRDGRRTEWPAGPGLMIGQP